MKEGDHLSDLQHRVESAGARFGEIAEDSRKRGERLADLLDEVESSFVRDRLEIDRLKQALAKATEENEQILALLQSLLIMVEQAEGPGEKALLCDIEARVDRLYDQTIVMNGEHEPPDEEPEEAARNSGAAGNGALSAAAPEGDTNGHAGEAPRWEPIPDEDEEVEAGDPLDFGRMAPHAGDVRPAGRAARWGGVAECDAVQDIFKRVSLITGKLRET